MSKAGPSTATSNGTASPAPSAAPANPAPAPAPPAQASASASTVRSAWSKGPPAIPAPTNNAGAASANGSGSAAGTRPSSVSGSPQLGAAPNGTMQGGSGNGNGNGAPNGQAKDAGSKKASLLAIGAEGKAGAGGQQAGSAKPMNIARAGQPGSAINFGSIDSPTTQLSSSPAAPTSTGSHLPSGLKSFGSIEAEAGQAQSAAGPTGGHGRKLSNMGGLVIPPFQGGAKSPSPAAAVEPAQPGQAIPSPQPQAQAQAGAAAPPKKFNPHALFQSNISPAPSMASASATSPPPVGGMPPNAPGQGMFLQQPGRPQMQQALGYDNQGRPLTMGGPGGQPFSPQQMPGMPNHTGQPFPGMNPYPHHQPGGVPQFRPAPGQPGMPNGLAGSRSPNMAHQQPHTFNPQQPQFRPQQQPGQNGPQQQGQRSAGPNSLSPRAQHQQLHPVPGGLGAYGMHPGMQGYPGVPYQGGYYAYGGYPDQQNPYGGMPQQWQGQQGRPGYPGAMPISPRNAPASLSGSSPAPSHAGLPGQTGASGNASPALSASRPSMGGSQAPHTLSHQNSGVSTASPQSSVPGTPVQGNARPFQPGSAFGHLSPAPGTPGSPMNPSLSAGASAFTPRVKVPLTFKRPDGTPFDVTAAAQSAKASSTAATASAASSEAGAATVRATPASSEAAKPKTTGLPYKPVVVRLETEAQKEARLAEEAKEKKIKEIEQKEEAERKERKAREETEKAEKAEKEKKDAEAKAEQERLDKEQAEKDAAAAKEAKAKAEADAKRKAEEEEQARKKAEEDKAATDKAEAAAKEESDAQAKKADSDAAAAEEKKAAAVPAVAEKAETASAAVSADPSPAASPALGAASLPNRPTSAAKRPQPLDLANSPTPCSPAIASAAAISSAKPIEDINSISYPSPLQSPSASLNTDASPGKFRYDRTFLLQFMEVCKEKPEALPPFAAIGMEADTSGGFGRGGSRTGQSRGSSSGMPRGGAGLGISNMGSFGGKGGMGAGMGSFGMGNFSSTKGTTSEERAAASARAGAAGAGIPSRMSSGGMMRAPSQTGPMGMSSFGRPSSRPGKKRPERAPAPSFNNPEPGVAPLELSANRWAPGVQNRRPGAADENSPEFVERKVKALLNKLTKEKFESISNQILEWANKSIKETDGQTLRLVIKLIFEKAKDEQFWSEMYARLCVKIHQQLSNEIQDSEMRNPDGNPITGGPLFRKYLLGRCQEDFEKGWKKREDATAAAKSKAEDDAQKKAEHDQAVAGGQQIEEFKFSDEYYAEQTAKRQGLGLVKFVGELFKLGLLSPKIIVACVKQLLRNVNDPDEEDVESLCQLLNTAGGGLDAHSPASKQTVDIFMQRMGELSNSEHISSRIRFMVVDVIELRRNGWVSRNAAANAGPMTIEEVHRAAAQEHAQAARAAAMAPPRGYDNMSRGGSRRGDQRVPHPGQHGQEGWQPAGRPPAKAADMSNFGKIQRSSGPTSFAGPASVFANKKTGKVGGDATPPLSRAASSVNMFSALAEGSGNAEAGPSESSTAVGTPDSGPQRKKLVLKPRTEPKEGEEGDAEEEEAEEEEGTPVAAATSGGDFEGSSMTKQEVERKIEADLKELWGEKDAAGTRRPEDIVEYFQYLPEGARSMLASKLVDDVFRIAKMADTEIVVKGLELAVEQDLITPEIVKQSVTPSVELLDDLVVDIPQAYTFAAKLILAGNLEDADVAELADKIEVFGEPVITPKDKLLMAVAKLNAEDAPAAA